MHVGEKPAVMTGRGPVQLSSGPLTLAAMAELLRELLPPEAQQPLDEFGAVESDLPPTSAGGAERYTVVAARGGDDIWIELRRQRVLPFDLPADASAAAPADASSAPVPVRSRIQRDEDRDSAESSATVLPLARSFVKPDGRRVITSPRLAGLDRLLRLAAARGAETLYLFSQARPSIRVDGEIGILDAEPVLGASDVEALLLEALPDPREEKADGTEWIVDIPEVGRVRCVSFRDHRGPGGVFRMIPARAISAEQLGLSREIQGLCAEPEGLVLVTGPRSSGKSTLMAAFVDVINRTRSDHVIALE